MCSLMQIQEMKQTEKKKQQQTTTQCEQQQKQLKTVACVGGGIVWVRD